MAGPVPFLAHVISGVLSSQEPPRPVHVNLSSSLLCVALRECPWAGSQPGRL